MKNTNKNSYFFFLVSFVVTALIVATPAFAQDKTGEIDKIFSWAKPDAPGCAVAVSQKGKLIVNRAHGSADLERDVALSTNSIFDIGSVRKQFVAAAVLLLVEEKRLSLSDDIRKHFPELPDYGHKITIDHLLTHTSGIRDRAGNAGRRKCRHIALDSASARTQFRARRGMVLLEQRLRAADGARHAHERDVVRRFHAQATVRAAWDEDDRLRRRPA